MKTFFIKTFGCKVNQYESQLIREIFLNEDYKEVGMEENPSICIVNTCCVTGKAEAKCRNMLHRLRRYNKNCTLIAIGCAVDYKPDFCFKTADVLIKNQDKLRIYDIINNYTDQSTEDIPVHSGRAEAQNVGLNGSKSILNDKTYNRKIITRFNGHTRAFIKVQDGCNEFCSYCILPYVRGRSRSRSLEEIVSEVETLVSNGYTEIILTGIHLADYHYSQMDLVDLLNVLEKISGLKRIRLSSIEPQDMTAKLIEKMAASSKICRHLHIPLQSGDDYILQKMNRKYTYKQYKDLLSKIRIKMPDILFSTDIIVGFPLENKENFLNSCKAVHEISFHKVHIFPYSLRAGTSASKLNQQVCSREIKNRLNILKEKAGNERLKVMKSLIGSYQDVLIEKSGTPSFGYSTGYMPVIIKQFMQSNTIAHVKITDFSIKGLVGEKN